MEIYLIVVFYTCTLCSIKSVTVLGLDFSLKFRLPRGLHSSWHTIPTADGTFQNTKQNITTDLKLHRVFTILNAIMHKISGCSKCVISFIFKKQLPAPSPSRLSSPAKDNNMPRSFLITRSAAAAAKPPAAPSAASAGKNRVR